jgi:signal transduction histidine kinase
LVTAARTLCHELSAQSGLRIGFAHENVPRELPAEVALCLYRVLQETLGNAIRHSGATEARVDLRMNNRHIHLTISDGGRGFDLAKARRDGGLGLLSMQERARVVGGRLTVQSEPGCGTRVELTVPFSRAAPGGVA